jgi:L-glyceraldehyde 3-phosphate reductase
MLPALSLGLWHNFGNDKPLEVADALCRTAFDHGITHFDLANNYGPPPGEAEITFGKILKTTFAGLRDEMVISTKAGFRMWPGPYGEWSSRKNLLASLDQSLKRMRLDYVDIFYSHRFDPDTPLEETMLALDSAVRQGKALYAGLSSYTSKRTREAMAILRRLGTPCIVHQPSYSMLNRWIEQDKLLDTLDAEGLGSVVFSPLSQGMLTDKYLAGVPQDSRGAGGQSPRLNAALQDGGDIAHVRALGAIAARRGQSLAQMALAWALRDKRVTSAVIGASRPEQIVDCLGALKQREFTAAELAEIDQHAGDGRFESQPRDR